MCKYDVDWGVYGFRAQNFEEYTNASTKPNCVCLTLLLEYYYCYHFILQRKLHTFICVYNFFLCNSSNQISKKNNIYF